MKSLNSKNLKLELWDALQQVKKKEIDPAIANAIATQSRELMRVVKMEVTIAGMCGEKPTRQLRDSFSGSGKDPGT